MLVALIDTPDRKFALFDHVVWPCDATNSLEVVLRQRASPVPDHLTVFEKWHMTDFFLFFGLISDFLNVRKLPAGFVSVFKMLVVVSRRDTRSCVASMDSFDLGEKKIHPHYIKKQVCQFQ